MLLNVFWGIFFALSTMRRGESFSSLWSLACGWNYQLDDDDAQSLGGIYSVAFLGWEVKSSPLCFLGIFEDPLHGWHILCTMCICNVRSRYSVLAASGMKKS